MCEAFRENIRFHDQPKQQCCVGPARDTGKKYWTSTISCPKIENCLPEKCPAPGFIDFLCVALKNSVFIYSLPEKIIFASPPLISPARQNSDR